MSTGPKQITAVSLVVLLLIIGCAQVTANRALLAHDTGGPTGPCAPGYRCCSWVRRLMKSRMLASHLHIVPNTGKQKEMPRKSMFQALQLHTRYAWLIEEMETVCQTL